MIDSFRYQNLSSRQISRQRVKRKRSFATWLGSEADLPVTIWDRYHFPKPDEQTIRDILFKRLYNVEVLLGTSSSKSLEWERQVRPPEAISNPP